MAIISFSAVGATASGDIAGYRATPYGVVLEFLEDRGHTIVAPGDPSATHFLSFDHNAKSFAAVARQVPAARRILLVFEPRVVIPANYRKSVRRRYGTVLTVATAGPDYLEWPQRDWRALPPKASSNRLAGSSALVNANKLSSISGSLYGLRRRVIESFAKEDLPLTLAGPNWTRRGRALLVENLRALAYAVLNREWLDLREWARAAPTTGSITYVGRVDDKEAVLQSAEFAVVIENSATYVSEKLFDAVFAGCVPLYVGPPLADYGIPESVAVVLPRSAGAFTDAVRHLTPAEKSATLAAGAAWLADAATHERWAMSRALERIAGRVDAAIEQGETS